jgi:outer membrane protein assembly factor BamB
MRCNLPMRAAVLVAALLSPPLLAGDAATERRWPQFRGPGGRGIAHGTIPLRWSATENVLWRTPIPGRGHSSPVVWDELVFLTTAIEGEVVPGAKAPYHFRKGGEFVHPDSVGADRRHRLDVLAIDSSTGAVRWSRTAHEGLVYDDRHRAGSYASPTCVTDGETVYAYFGSEGVFAYDFAGELAWRRDIGDLKTFGMSVGTSPILWRDLVIVQADAEDGSDSFLIGLDKRTGTEMWKTSRRPIQVSWTTPAIAEDGRGGAQLLANGWEMVAAYDPASGRELWRVPGMDSNTVQMPLHGDGLAFFAAGHPRKIVMAVRLGPDAAPALAPDAPAGAERVAWTYGKGTGYVPTNLLHDGLLYLVNDSGTLTCLDASTGAVVYEGGRVEAPGNVMASLVAGGGRILIVNRDGDATVVAAGRLHRVLATNSIDEAVYATPALAGARLFLRGERHLYAIAAEEPPRRLGAPTASGSSAGRRR